LLSASGFADAPGQGGLVSAEGLGNVRKWAVVAILTLAALITPPDVITQVILFVWFTGFTRFRSSWCVWWNVHATASA
jgi:Sec-independent protein secretion pathway component TatC